MVTTSSQTLIESDLGEGQRSRQAASSLSTLCGVVKLSSSSSLAKQKAYKKLSNCDRESIKGIQVIPHKIKELFELNCPLHGLQLEVTPRIGKWVQGRPFGKEVRVVLIHVVARSIKVVSRD